MKLVKLNRTHKLFRDSGCSHAWRFEGFCLEASRLERFFEDKFGTRYSRKGSAKWASGYGANARITIEIPGVHQTYTHSRTIYWVGIKDPKDLPFLLLQINDLATD